MTAYAQDFARTWKRLVDPAPPGPPTPLLNDFTFSSPVNPVDHINMWKNNVESSGFDYYPNGFGQADAFPTQDYGFDTFDNGSQYDYSAASSYAHSSAAPSEYEYSQSRRNKAGHFSARTQKATRRESSQSIPQTTGGYADGTYYLNPNPTISPTMDVEFFPQYTHTENNFHQNYPVHEPMLDSASSDGETSGTSESSTPARSHPLYNAAPADDGLYYCPFAETEGCGHEPKQLKCEYDKYIDSHLKPFRCRHDKCAELQFSSTACLLRHEREAHEMHGHEESLCEYPPCNRSMPGNGFRRSYNCKDHMTRCHGWIDHNPQEGKKRRNASIVATNGAKVTKVKASKIPSKKQQIAQLKDEWAKRKANLEDLTRGLAPDGPLFAIALTQINNEMQTLKSIQIEWSKLTGRTTIG